MKQPERTRPLTMDRTPPLNTSRNIVVAIAIGVAFVAAIYLAIG